MKSINNNSDVRTKKSRQTRQTKNSIKTNRTNNLTRRTKINLQNSIQIIET